MSSPMDNTTFGLFHATIQFTSQERLKAWEEELLDFSAPGIKEKFAPISRIWMDDYPRTTITGSSISIAMKTHFTLDEALEHFNKTANMPIEKDEIIRMDVSKEGDQIWHTFVLKGRLPHPLKINK